MDRDISADKYTKWEVETAHTKLRQYSRIKSYVRSETFNYSQHVQGGVGWRRGRCELVHMYKAPHGVHLWMHLLHLLEALWDESSVLQIHFIKGGHRESSITLLTSEFISPDLLSRTANWACWFPFMQFLIFTHTPGSMDATRESTQEDMWVIMYDKVCCTNIKDKVETAKSVVFPPLCVILSIDTTWHRGAQPFQT